jgi:HD-GYP domain-containing protein (c-di-GMP phosphodiesterase class II)
MRTGIQTICMSPDVTRGEWIDILDGTHQRQHAALLLTLKIKDTELYRHSIRVQYFTHRLAQVLKLPNDEVTTIGLAALFHDIGKIVLPDALLRKASGLSQQEFEAIKQHPVYGALILARMSLLGDDEVQVVYHHHERWNGGGYPYGLRGEAIPLGARMVAIADAFEAMTSHRPYQAIRTPTQALEELGRCAGTQFDPVLVDHFCTALAADLPETFDIDRYHDSRQKQSMTIIAAG